MNCPKIFQKKFDSILPKSNLQNYLRNKISSKKGVYLFCPVYTVHHIRPSDEVCVCVCRCVCVGVRVCVQKFSAKPSVWREGEGRGGGGGGCDGWRSWKRVMPHSR